MTRCSDEILPFRSATSNTQKLNPGMNRIDRGGRHSSIHFGDLACGLWSLREREQQGSARIYSFSPAMSDGAAFMVHVACCHGRGVRRRFPLLVHLSRKGTDPDVRGLLYTKRGLICPCTGAFSGMEPRDPSGIFRNSVSGLAKFYLVARTSDTPHLFWLAVLVSLQNSDHKTSARDGAFSSVGSVRGPNKRLKFKRLLE